MRFEIRLVERKSPLTTRVRKQEKVLPERRVSSCIWTFSSRLQTPEGIPGWEAFLSLCAGYEAGCVVTRLSERENSTHFRAVFFWVTGRGQEPVLYVLAICNREPCCQTRGKGTQVERDHTFQLCFLGTQHRQVQEKVLKLVSVCPETVPYSEQNLVSTQ